MRLRRNDAIERLGISKTKFDRLVRLGEIAVERDEKEMIAGKPAVYVTLHELGKYLRIEDETALRVRLDLPTEKSAESFVRPSDETTAPEPEPVPLSLREGLPVRPLTEFERKELADAEIAHDAVTDADWRDSFGHRLAGNDRHAMIEAPEHTPQDTQQHMDPALLGTHRSDGTPIEMSEHASGFTRSGTPLAAGLSQDTYNAMMKDWNRSHYGWDALSMSEQREAVERSRSVVSRAFPRAERQRSVHDTRYTPNGGRIQQR